MVRYIVDSASPDITYHCPTSIHNSSTHFGGSWTSIEDASCGSSWFSHNFIGSRVEVQAALSQARAYNYSVTLDANAPLTGYTALADPLNGFNGGGAYSSPVLDDEKHDLTYATDAQSLFPVFDYLVVTTKSPSANLKHKTIVLDNINTALEFRGDGWDSARVDSAMAFGYSTAVFGDTVSWVSEAGNSFSFTFEGTSAAVYVLLPQASEGQSMTWAFEVDGRGSVGAVLVTNDETSPRAMHPLVEVTTEAGPHTFSANVTNVSGGYKVGFDFVTFNSSVGTVEQVQRAIAAAPLTGSSSSSGSRHHTGAIVGGVVGGLAFIAIVTLVLWVMRRRSMRRAKTNNAARAMSRRWIPDTKSIPAAEYSMQPVRNTSTA
ncbi:hypothetical protein CYLTODRAFT_421045 [Cylindrobasidium torrendii FP15055 ss-10]|uniref:Uncharacterized protein n=1 Tax=Cylindrobasidium torrendii FP15055 ss-10 TaxID=1314674 RepID=A0A0D7BF14_9AGAR|nr:hypothetical protein CYLTODRAFT_421045 [Cylindrobasidium torrendii FP15055 ss-10]